MWMRRIAILGFVALLLANKWGHLPYPDARELHGAWEIMAIERHGEADPSLAVGYHMTFSADEVHFSVLPWTGPTTKSEVAAAAKIEPVAEERSRLAALS